LIACIQQACAEQKERSSAPAVAVALSHTMDQTPPNATWGQAELMVLPIANANANFDS